MPAYSWTGVTYDVDFSDFHVFIVFYFLFHTEQFFVLPRHFAHERLSNQRAC